MAAKKRIAVVGTGSWGTTLANVFSDAECPTVIWGRDDKVVQEIKTKHQNSKYLKGLSLNPKLQASSDLEKTVREADWVVCSIPTQKIREVFSPLAKALENKLVINSSKGIEIGTHLRVSEIFAQVAPKTQYAILSGPSFAHETIQRLPTAVTVASKSIELAAEIQQAMNTGYFRAYRSKDVIGVEFAGALKNVLAIASGVVTGLNLGHNAQAALINRGMAEILKISKVKQSDPLTLMGLAGAGDIILTCTGPLSRNRKLGELLGEGKNFKEAEAKLGGVAEGYYTAHSAYELAQNYGVEAPIIEEVYQILYQGRAPMEAVNYLMSRDLKEEW